MIFDKNKTACFSGYRPHKLDIPLSDNYELMRETFNVIAETISAEYDTFLIGCAPGWDIFCAELTQLARRVRNRDARIICVLPYGNFSDSHHFDESWQARYINIKALSQEIINVTDKSYETQGCFQRRNEFMIDNSSLLICYHTGKAGGTANTIQYAKNKGLNIINIADSLL